MLFTVYRPDTGDIVKSGTCLPEDLSLQAGEGEAVIAGEAIDDTKWRIVGGAKVPRLVDLAELEHMLLAMIDRQADDVHARMMPKSASLAAAHAAKKAEALALQADPDIAEDMTPRLTLEAGTLGIGRASVAAVVLARAAEDETLSALIDDIRRTGKSAVRAAGTEDGKRAAAEAIDWSPVTD